MIQRNKGWLNVHWADYGRTIPVLGRKRQGLFHKWTEQKPNLCIYQIYLIADTNDNDNIADTNDNDEALTDGTTPAGSGVDSLFRFAKVQLYQ